MSGIRAMACGQALAEAPIDAVVQLLGYFSEVVDEAIAAVALCGGLAPAWFKSYYDKKNNYYCKRHWNIKHRILNKNGFYDKKKKIRTKRIIDRVIKI